MLGTMMEIIRDHKGTLILDTTKISRDIILIIHRDITKRVKIKASYFDGKLNSNTFLYWLVDIEDFFEWYDMTDG